MTINTVPKLIIIGGMPSTGKTVLRQRIMDHYPDAHLFCPDEDIENIARQEGISVSKAFKENLFDVTKKAWDNLEVAAQEGKTIIAERVNLSTKARIMFREKSSVKEYEKICHFILPPRNDEEDALLSERLTQRMGKMLCSADAIREYKHMIQIPNTEEGYSSVHYYDMHGNEVSCELRYEKGAWQEREYYHV